MKLEIAQKIVAAALAAARTRSFKPLAVSVLDARGALKAFAAEDGTSLKRAEIATGKAQSAYQPFAARRRALPRAGKARRGFGIEHFMARAIELGRRAAFAKPLRQFDRCFG